MNIKITGSGSYIPTEVVSNIDFAKHVFLNDDGTPFPHPNDVVAEKFLEIRIFTEERAKAAKEFSGCCLAFPTFYKDYDSKHDNEQCTDDFRHQQVLCGINHTNHIFFPSFFS